MPYLVGIDIGGTFTDCALVDRAGKLLATKVPSTPQDFSQGIPEKGCQGRPHHHPGP
jgi:N-methylhydantoinase A